VTKHSYTSVRGSPHFLDWENKPLPYKIYPELPAIALPRDLALSQMPALAAIASTPSEAGGAAFDAVARQSSDGPTAAQGGDLGYFQRGTLARELENRAFAMRPGEVGDVVRTKQGFLILKVIEHEQAGVAPLKDVERQIEDQLYFQKLQPTLRTYLTKLREDAYIDIRPGYVDTGASPNQTKPVFTTAAAQGPKSKKRHKKLGIF
jgi:peptidyl-prolyl cis-trans isomerase SurA